MNNTENNEFDENASLIWEEDKDPGSEKDQSKKQNIAYKFFGLFLLIISAVSFTNFTVIFEPDDDIILSITFIIAGLTMNYKSLGTNNNYIIFISSTLFLAGVFNFIFNEFYIINAGSFIFSLIIGVTGCALIILFINSNIQKYLIYGIAFILAAVITILFFRDSIVNFYLSNIVIRLLDFWEMITIVIGINLLIKYR